MSDNKREDPKFGIRPNENYNSICSKIKNDLWKCIKLFHESLASWNLKCDDKESFKHEITSFLSIFIKKIQSTPSLEIKDSSNIENDLIRKIQNNRNIEMINLCKQMFDQIDTHRSIVGGFIQAMAVASKSNDNFQVLLIDYSFKIYFKIFFLKILCLDYFICIFFLQLDHDWVTIFAYPETFSCRLIDDCLAIGVAQSSKISSSKNSYVNGRLKRGNSSVHDYLEIF